MLSYNTHEISRERLTTRVFEENNKIVVMLEQNDGCCFINFNSEKQFKEFVFDLASSFGLIEKEAVQWI